MHTRTKTRARAMLFRQAGRLFMSAKRFQPFANIEMFLRMFTNFARKCRFCYSHFTKLTKFAFLCKKICIYQKKAVPLHQNYKTNQMY